MAEHPHAVITDLNDTRLDVYRDLKKSNRTRNQEIFIAEGRLVVERLLESDYELVSVLVSEERLERIRDRLNESMPVLVVPHALCSELVGFNFHGGILGCGKRKRLPRVPVDTLPHDQPVTLVACPQVTMPDNLGSIIRLAAAFDANGMIVGQMSADAFSRRVIRVSMGNIFHLPIYEPFDLHDELKRLSTEGQFEILGTTRNPEAVPLKQFKRSLRTIIMLGNEAEGLNEEQLRLCHRQITIEMVKQVDSLNVSTAAGIFLYELCTESLPR